MAMIQLKNLTFSYPAGQDTLFDHVNLQFDTHWKLGLIGKNGQGKTTFLHLLLGRHAYQGTLLSPVSFVGFPHPVTQPERLTGDVLQEAAPHTEAWTWLRELSYLDVDPAVLARPFATLSQGEQTKVLLAALFLQEGQFPLIDEPTNHLDQPARAVVSAYLDRQKGFLVVSHDQAFLDGCIDHVLCLDQGAFQLQNGTVAAWLENASQQEASALAQRQRLQKDIRRLHAAAQRTSAWSHRVEAAKYGAGPVDRGYLGHKAAKMMKRSKAIEARQQQAIQEAKSLLKHQDASEPLKLSPLPHHADPLVRVSQVAVQYGEVPVGAPVSFSIGQGERVALQGKNGSGKSSLLQLLMGEPLPHTGTITTPSDLILSYLPQETAHLQGSLTHFAQDHQVEETLLKTILRKLGMPRLQFDQPLETFSDGQKRKVLLAKSLCQRAHLYVWDEPLNFLDLDARRQLEALLQTAAPTLLFVEHDRAFCENIATKTIHLE